MVSAHEYFRVHYGHMCTTVKAQLVGYRQMAMCTSVTGSPNRTFGVGEIACPTGYFILFPLQREFAVGVDKSTGVPPEPGPMTTVLALFDAARRLSSWMRSNSSIDGVKLAATIWL